MLTHFANLHVNANKFKLENRKFIKMFAIELLLEMKLTSTFLYILGDEIKAAMVFISLVFKF